MNTEQLISDEALACICAALLHHQNWMAYQETSFLLGEEGLHFFRQRKDAYDFAFENSTAGEPYHVIYAVSVLDVFRQLSYEGELGSRNMILQTINTKNMNQQNLDYLKENLKYMGFGESLSAALETKIKENLLGFSLVYKAEVHKKPFEAELHFRKSDATDLYFFNSYTASLERTNGEKMEQTFYVSKGKGITAKEAYNLLEGRAVHKTLSNKAGESYSAWLQLDLEKRDKQINYEVKQFHENFGYDLKGAVVKFAISELQDPEKEKALLQSLQKGNLQAVTIEKDGSVHKMFVEANPQYKTVNLYDGQMKRVQKESLDQYQSVKPSLEGEVKPEQVVKQEMSKEQRQKVNGAVVKPAQSKSHTPKKSTKV